MDYYKTCRGPLFRPGGIILTKKAIEFCKFKDGVCLADIGCGAGETKRLIEMSYPINVINVEPSAPMAAGNKNIIKANIESTPFGNSELDGALCECVLSLCKDIKAAFKELHRIIKPGGYLIISDVYSKTASAELSEFTNMVKYLYTKEFFCGLLKENGFSAVLFEDHTRMLTLMYAKLIMEGSDLDCSQSFDDITNMGYLLLIGRKS